MDSEKRLIDLETKFMFQEELLSELNKIVTKQQITIDSLSRELKSVSEGLGGDSSNPKDEKPPHY